MTMNVVWEDPPDSQRNRTKRFIETLKTRPGEWAIYPFILSGAAQVTNFRKRFPGTEWASRKHPDDPTKIVLYGRWVGDDGGRAVSDGS